MVKEVPIKTIYGDEKSHFTAIDVRNLFTYYFILNLLK